MLTLEAARERVLARLPEPTNESVALAAACGRVLAKPVTAARPLPPFDNSAMDGYALRAEDVAGATADHPVALRLKGEVPAGRAFAGQIKSGACVRIFTGSPLPGGADAVVIQEDTSTDAARPDEVLVLDKVRPWENIRLRGEDVKAGAVVAGPGTRLNAAHLGLLGAVGADPVTVTKQPVVALLATGDELREPGQPLEPGQIQESNRAMLAALVAQTGAVPRVFPLVADTPQATQSALTDALASCDAVITSGGASVGDHDHVKQAFAGLGGSVEFWRVAIKPGKPFLFGLASGKPLFGLPGNPVSAFVTFLVLVRPALFHILGDSAPPLSTHAAELAGPLVNHGDRRHFMRVHVDPDGRAQPMPLQASHALGSLAAANGLVDVAPHTTLAPGARVTVLRWD
jgi:molybdopterin molybdotransferase